MPELPDITIYLEALESRIVGELLLGVRLGNPFVLRTADPALLQVIGRKVHAVRRLGKRIAIGCDGDLWLVLHLMIAGRLHWQAPHARLRGRQSLAAFDFPRGTLILTEAGTKRRASLHLVAGDVGLRAHDPGGIDVLTCTLAEFTAALQRETHTLKRALTDPRLFSGIGNAYSDEILHAARLSPVQLTQKLDADEIARLHRATRETLIAWTERLRRATGSAFPENVTAFRPEMAVHGKFGRPCPVCGTRVQRIRYADNETNYCPTCQTGGRLLADRALSRLLKADWPRTIGELEQG